MRLFIGLLALFVCVRLSAQVNVLQNRYDRFSRASNDQEALLTPDLVKSGNFGKIFSYYVDGAVYAQPLYVSGLQIPSRGTHNVLYVATMNDKVYAFDADRSGPPLWRRDLTDESMGVTPVPISDITNSNELNIVGNAGIESTPVIDLSGNALFLLARTKENGQYVQRVHSLDLLDGHDQLPPVTVTAQVPGSAKDAVKGMVSFDPRAGHQRAALALAKGNLVLAWASHEDLRPYHGWIMSYDAKTLRQNGALCITPDTADGGVWQSGRGPVVDKNGALYFEVGNGGWDGKRNFGNSLIKVEVTARGLGVSDFYTPADYVHQNETDADLGSSGPLLIEDKDLLIAGNKQGQVLQLKASHLGGLSPSDTGILSTLDLRSGRVMAGPALSDGPGGSSFYIWNETGVAQAFKLGTRLLEVNAIAKGTVLSRASPGGALTLSSNHSQVATGVLWATVGKSKSADHGNAAGVFRALNADTLEELWNSEQNAKRDRLGTLVKFVPPVVANGRVYIPNYDNAVNVYGRVQ